MRLYIAGVAIKLSQAQHLKTTFTRTKTRLVFSQTMRRRTLTRTCLPAAGKTAGSPGILYRTAQSENPEKTAKICETGNQVRPFPGLRDVFTAASSPGLTTLRFKRGRSAQAAVDFHWRSYNSTPEFLWNLIPPPKLAALQAQTRRIRQVRYRPSRLDRYTGELLSLYQAGASAAELQRWLRARRIKVVLSTVTRWLEKMAKFASAARQAAGVIKPLGEIFCALSVRSGITSRD